MTRKLNFKFHLILLEVKIAILWLVADVMDSAGVVGKTLESN